MSRRRHEEETPRDRRSRSSTPPVEKLIEQRRLIEEWLDKLAAGGLDGMPSHVIERVRNDYTSRLAAITKELGEHGDVVRQRLDEAEQRRETLETEQKARRDELAEMKIRRQVGELDEAKFREQQRELKETLDNITKELAAALREIDRFEEILDTMDRAEAEDEDEDEVEDVAEADDAEQEEQAVVAKKSGPISKTLPRKAEAPPPPPPAPAPAPPAAPAKPAPGPGTLEKDELGFLRSLTTQQAAVKPPATKPPQPPPVTKQPEAEEKIEIEHPIDPTKPRDRPSLIQRAQPEGEKTLTCQECGAKNLPTEWYCEKCGAELSNF